MYFRWLILGVFLVFGALPSFTEAATLYMQPNVVEIKRGETVSLSVRIDTDEAECINVIDGVITYPPNIEPVDTSRGNSILSVWVEDPVIDKVNRTITFAGGIPNGYCGRIAGDPRLTNVVLEVLFRSPGMVIGTVADMDTATIAFDPQTQVFLNDGFGTLATLGTLDATIHLSKEVFSEVGNVWNERVSADTRPPERFSIALESTPNAFSNKYYIVFNTTDKQSGIDHYEVMEEPLEDQKLFNWGAETAPWVTARSPYVLEDQTLNSTIRVRAVDKAGNEYVATLVPEDSKRSISNEAKIMIALVITVIVVFIGVAIASFFWYRRRKRKEEVDESLETYEEIE